MIKEPLQIGTMELRNRIVMPPMATYICGADGKVGEELLAHYEKRAEGGHIGLIITEHSYFLKQGKAGVKQLSIADDSDIEGLKQLTERIHRSGTKAMVQLNHAGAAAPFEATGLPAVSASSIIPPTNPVMGDGRIPEELTKAQIREIVNAWAAAALRAKEAGYDGVEIHSAHAYLLNQFYSPLTNHRADEYGGKLENRLRFHCEVVHAVREAVGTDVPIALRLGGCDHMDGGNTVEDAANAAVILEEAGIDMIDISGGMCRYIRAGHPEAGYFRETSAAVKKKVSIPVMLTGGVTSAEEAERLLQEGAADLIGVGRALLNNEKWADQIGRAHV